MRRMRNLFYQFGIKKANQIKSMQKSIRTQIELVEREAVNHDSYIFRFKFVGKDIPLTIGKHFVVSQHLPTWQRPEGEVVNRKYTPLSHKLKNGLMDVLIKIYRPNVHPKFPNGGKLTPFLQKLPIGQKIEVEGPLGRFDYSRGLVKVLGQEPFPVDKIVMIAGGSGITPIFNVANEIFQDKDDKTEIVILACHRSEEDILLRKELDQMKPRVKVYYMIDIGHEGWDGFVGHVRKQVLSSITGLEEERTFYCFSGPFLMNETIRGIFKEHPKTNIFKF